MKRNFKPKSMKNTLKLILAAFVVAIAASCGAKTDSNENKDSVVVETPAAAPDTTTVPSDTIAVDSATVK
jgi:hypothetical protein